MPMVRSIHRVWGEQFIADPIAGAEQWRCLQKPAEAWFSRSGDRTDYERLKHFTVNKDFQALAMPGAAYGPGCGQAHSRGAVTRA
jgi:hypothetical protein